MRSKLRSWPLLVCFLGSVSVLSAQGVPTVRSGSFELGGFVGATYGIGAYAVMGGGNLSYAATKYLLPYVEYSYFPEIQRHATGTITNSNFPWAADYSLSGNDFHGGVHLRVPIRESRFVPYGVFGVGRMGFSSSTVHITYKDNAGVSHDAGTISTPSGGGRATINFGGGVRYYVNPRYGFRIEVKGYKPFGEPASTNANFGFANTFLKAEGGFFIQFH